MDTIIVRTFSPSVLAKTHTHKLNELHTHTHTPISDTAGAQQDFGVSAPFPLQHDIYIHRLIIYKDLLHAAVEARQLGHTASRVIGLRTTCNTADIKYSSNYLLYNYKALYISYLA